MITEILATALREAGIAIDGKQLEMMDRYACHLAETNRVMNLTAITDPEGIALKHFFDCILVLQKLDPPKGARVIDVGTGAGFPGIPFAIMRPDLSSTPARCDRKRNFVSSSRGSRCSAFPR